MTPNSLDRRQFIRNSAAAAAGLAVGTCGLATLPAAEPVPRIGKPKFKFSLAAYSYRKLLSGNEPELTLHDFIRDCAEMQLDATELTSYYFPPEPTGDYLRELKKQAFELGLDVSGTAIRDDLCYAPGEKRDGEIAHVKKWIEHAEVLGAPVIRIFSGKAQSGQSEEDARKLAIAGMQECCEYAGQHGVFLALENHGGLTTEIRDLVSLVEQVKSPWMGINLDTGNFHACKSAEEAYADMAKMAPYALNVQVKVTIALANGERAEADYNRIATILKESAYRGYVVLEYEEGGDPRKESPRQIEKLREAFA